MADRIDEKRAFTPRFGQFEFGFRATTVDGDEAWYNRMRDLRTGPFLNALRIDRAEADWGVPWRGE